MREAWASADRADVENKKGEDYLSVWLPTLASVGKWLISLRRHLSSNEQPDSVVKSKPGQSEALAGRLDHFGLSWNILEHFAATAGCIVLGVRCAEGKATNCV